MAESLFPSFPEIEVYEADDTVVNTFSASYMFDHDKGEFVTDGANRVVVCNGYDAWKSWCLKTIQTERDSCLAYSTNIGIELENALKSGTTEAVKLVLERTITEALLIHPSTQSVGEFELSIVGDSLSASFLVKGKNVPAFTASLDVVIP